MRKWEEEFNKFKNGDKDQEISELQDKFSNKTINKEEYDLLQKNLKVKANIQKVENILEYREKLKGKLQELKTEKENRQAIIDLNKEKEKFEKEKQELEDKMVLHQKQLELLNKELKNKDKTPEQIEKLQNAKKDCIAEIDENNSLFAKNAEEIKKIDDSVNEKNSKLMENITDEQLGKNTLEISTKISKCNMIASNLMKGASWDSIELKLDNWKDRKFTRKVDEKDILEYYKNNKPAEEKAPEEKPAEEKSVEEKPVEEKPVEEEIIEEELDEEEIHEEVFEDKNKFMMVISNFADKHPRIASFFRNIRDGFSNIVNRFREIGNDEEEILEDDLVEDKPIRPIEENPIKETEEKAIEENTTEERTSKDNDFKKYIRDIAEHGMKEADQNRLREFRENRNKSQENNKDER